jgi:hypothetical protein
MRPNSPEGTHSVEKFPGGDPFGRHIPHTARIRETHSPEGTYWEEKFPGGDLLRLPVSSGPPEIVSVILSLRRIRNFGRTTRHGSFVVPRQADTSPLKARRNGNRRRP